MAIDLRSTFVYWEQIGVFDVLLPFFLVFSVSYAILKQTKVLVDERINILVAAIIGILFVQNEYLVGILQSFIPNVSMVLIVILMLMLLAGVFLGEKSAGGGAFAYGVAAIIAIVFVLWSLNAQGGGYAFGISDYFDDQTTATLILIGIFAFVIWYVTKPAQSKGWETFNNVIGELWRGGGKK